jgi:hypothetical protein
MLRRWFMRFISKPEGLTTLKARVCRFSDEIRGFLLHFLDNLSQGVAYDALFNTCIAKPEYSVAKDILTPQSAQFKQALHGVSLSPSTKQKGVWGSYLFINLATVAKTILKNLLNNEIDHPLFDSEFHKTSRVIEQKLGRIHEQFGSNSKPTASPDITSASIVKVSAIRYHSAYSFLYLLIHCDHLNIVRAISPTKTWYLRRYHSMKFYLLVDQTHTF